MFSFIFFLLFIIILLVFKNIKIDILNPVLIIVYIWAGMLFFYELDLFSNFPKLNSYTIIFIFLTIFLLLMGIILGFKTHNFNISEPLSEYNLAKVHRISIILLIVVYLSFIATVIILGVPPILGGEVPRHSYYLPGIERLYLMIYVYWFITFFQISSQYKIKKNLFGLLFSLIPVILKGNKFQIIVFILLYMFFLGLRKKKINLNYLLISFIVIIFIFNYVSKSF